MGHELPNAKQDRATPLSTDARGTYEALQSSIGKQYGAIFRKLTVQDEQGSPVPAYILIFEGHVDLDRVEEHLIRPLLDGSVRASESDLRKLIPFPMRVGTVGEATSWVIRGMVLLHVDGFKPQVFALNDLPTRDVATPETESGVAGPREAFNEDILTNLSQLRRRFPGMELKLEEIWIGDKARIRTFIAYLSNRPTEKMLNEVRHRIRRVQEDGIQDLFQLTESLADHRVTLFPTVLATERPDLVCHHLLAGRIAVLMENSPRALVVPALFMDFLASVDDYYEWRPYVVFMRVLRAVAFLIAVPLPAIYVSITTYHLQALPTLITLSLLGQREGAPLPAPVEALIMSVMFEVLREAGIRLPRAIGPTVSIVGGLVIGDAAIRSGIASPAMVLVVSATAVSTFALPSTTLANTSTYLRFFLLLLASGLGFFGLLIGYLLVLANVSGTTSLGVPYQTPLYPLQLRRLSAAIGIKARPPVYLGAVPHPDLTNTAEQFTEEEEE